jgi:asparagine synthase (glutamine-hydrolysing)
MCGITGKLFFDDTRAVKIRDLKSMTDMISHRGPDDHGYYIDKNMGMGFRRLSIIDLISGHQPLSDSNGRYWITFNGEIYNFQELRNGLQKKGYIFKTSTDTEVIVNLFAEHKEKCLEYLRGMFAFVIWDKKEKLLFGARDRFGIKPFHYYIDQEKFIWGSEIKSIINCPDIDKTISLESLDYYFAYGYSGRKNTIYKQIKKLKPAHYFFLKPSETKYLKEQSYWQIHFQPDYSKSENYWKEAIYDCLSESVKMRMISDVPLGAFLSGGIDSSTVVSLMAKNSTRPIKTFSIGFKEKKYNELKYARQVAQKYKTEHHELIVEPESIELLPRLVHAYDEPFADSSSIPTYYVSKFAKEFVTVILSGDGGDELFAGYTKYSKMVALNDAIYNNSFTNNYIFKKLNKILPDYMYGKGYTFYLSKNKFQLAAYFGLWKEYERTKIFTNDVREQILLNTAEISKLKLLENMDWNFISRLQHLDINTYLADDILTKVDRASMMNSLEARVPILDHKLAELSFKIPESLKLKNRNKKYIFKKSFEHILPNEILSHPKKGFGVPLNIWFKDNLKDYAFDILLNETNLSTYLNKNYIREILMNHQKGLRDYSSKIWSLLFLNEWLAQNN